jgi:hypothetical protein
LGDVATTFLFGGEAEAGELPKVENTGERQYVSRAVRGEGINSYLSPVEAPVASSETALTPEAYENAMKILERPDLSPSDREQLEKLLEKAGYDLSETPESGSIDAKVGGSGIDEMIPTQSTTVVESVGSVEKTPDFDKVLVEKDLMTNTIENLNSALEKNGSVSDRAILDTVYNIASKTYGNGAGPVEQWNVWTQMKENMNIDLDNQSPATRKAFALAESFMKTRLEAFERGVFRQ